MIKDFGIVRLLLLEFLNHWLEIGKDGNIKESY